MNGSSSSVLTGRAAPTTRFQVSMSTSAKLSPTGMNRPPWAPRPAAARWNRPDSSSADSTVAERLAVRDKHAPVLRGADERVGKQFVGGREQVGLMCLEPGQRR